MQAWDVIRNIEALIAGGAVSGCIDVAAIARTLTPLLTELSQTPAAPQWLHKWRLWAEQVLEGIAPGETLWLTGADWAPQAAPLTTVQTSPGNYLRVSDLSDARSIALAAATLGILKSHTAPPTQLSCGPLVTLRCRDLPLELPPTAAEEALWDALLEQLTEMSADDRPIAVWVAPTWVVDLVSPYARDILPMLQRWSMDQPHLSTLHAQLNAGDMEAAYACAALLCESAQGVLEERREVERGEGIVAITRSDITLHSAASAEPVAYVVDTARLDWSCVDPRLLALVETLPEEPPIVLILNAALTDRTDMRAGWQERLLIRLLCDAEAPLQSLVICAQGLISEEMSEETSEEKPAAVAALCARQCDGLTYLVAPAEDLPLWSKGALHLLPSRDYLDSPLLALQPPQDIAMETDALLQNALLEALSQQIELPLHTQQRVWLTPIPAESALQEDQALIQLEQRRRHTPDALKVWQSLLLPPSDP